MTDFLRTKHILKLVMDATEIKLIADSIRNIGIFRLIHDERSPAALKLFIIFISNTESVCNAILTFCNFMNDRHIPNGCKIIEELVFNMVFEPSQDDPSTKVYSVYQMHDNLIQGECPFANFKSSKGSGKTRCAPYFFSIRTIQEGMTHPFFIMNW